MSRPVLRVIRGGLMTTVQDLGRPGHGHLGVPLGGALDRLSHRLANRLVGNADGAAAIEMTLRGDELEVLEDTVLAVCGAEMQADCEPPSGRIVALPCQRPVAVRRGCVLRFRSAIRGCRATLAVAGGLDVPEVLSSRSTLLRSGWGGFQGRRLEAGDELAAEENHGGAVFPFPKAELEFPAWHIRLQSLPGTDDAVLRFLPGTHYQRLRGDARARLLEQAFEVRPESDRMGYRLRGPALELDDPEAGRMKSAAVVPGTLQLPQDGQLLLLMADCAPTGGYPRVGHVISADLPLAAQLRPGSRLRLKLCTQGEAMMAIRSEERQLVAALTVAQLS